ENRATFAGGTYRTEGRPWWEWHQVATSRLSGKAITWSFIQTHNHFTFLRNVRLHNRSAPVIKLSEGASEEDHLELLGVLNSSTACFWLKQNSHDKGNGGYGGGIASTEWERFYELTGTTVKDFPLPAPLPLDRARLLDSLAQEAAANAPSSSVKSTLPSTESLETARSANGRLRAQMISQQEELDWEVYSLYGLIDEDLTYTGDDLPELELGERAFEIVLARQIQEGTESS